MAKCHTLFWCKGNTYKGHYYCRGHDGCYVSNSIGPFKLESGFHGLSNHPKTSPYQKTEYGLENIKSIVQNHLGCVINFWLKFTFFVLLHFLSNLKGSIWQIFVNLLKSEFEATSTWWKNI